jgi:uncharacterized protein
MNNPTIQQPLSDDELNRLGEFLDEIGPPAMNMESLDGYFAALICGPDMVLPSEYLPGIWGEDFCFDSDHQATDILGLLMRHWGTISSECTRQRLGTRLHAWRSSTPGELARADRQR